MILSVLLVAGALSHGSALGVQKHSEAASSYVIPEWKIDLVSGNGDDWWSKYGVQAIAESIKGAIWGASLPEVTGTPAQDAQRCPILKLPDNLVLAAKRRSWTGLYGEWNTASGINLATWEQSYLGIGFSRDIKRIGVYIRTASTRQVAVRTRYFTDTEMLRLFDWKEATKSAIITSNASNATSSPTNSSATAFQAKEEPFNLAIFDCAGTLMYVVKELDEVPRYVKLYGRDGTVVAQTSIGEPILRYQFTDPSSGYLLATAEAPGINASVRSADIPLDVQVGEVKPFGMHFEMGGYTNSSALMEIEYRYVLASAVQALAIYEGAAELSWGIITAVETFLVICIAAAFLLLVGLLYGTFRCVYPYGLHSKDVYGRIADNPFLAVPARPPHRDELAEALKSRSFGYGADK